LRVVNKAVFSGSTLTEYRQECTINAQQGGNYATIPKSPRG